MVCGLDGFLVNWMVCHSIYGLVTTLFGWIVSDSAILRSFLNSQYHFNIIHSVLYTNNQSYIPTDARERVINCT